jgi:hypothetical protein
VEKYNGIPRVANYPLTDEFIAAGQTEFERRLEERRLALLAQGIVEEGVKDPEAEKM